MAFLGKNRGKIGVDNHGLITHSIPYIPKEGFMALRKTNHNLYFDFFQGASDLNKNVFINLRKQTRQKMEGISASQF